MVQTKQITLRDRIQQIEDAISAGQIEDAMSTCQRILAQYPDALEIQRLLGEVNLAQGRLDEAQQTFDWILVNDPENVLVYCDRALICEHNSDIDIALDCYQQAYELSRGNAQILQEFNALSARAGQQEFMLSRAGLARLYMRGHLFTQAEYEWEAVLAVSPDRLDARLGLLETYWREGKYEEVEPLATRILEEVPQCLKALLLLAHVTSASNPQRAQGLIEQAVLLDPELLMAQDLFSEYAKIQPGDPFLALIRRVPIELTDDEMNNNGSAIETLNTLQYATIDIEADLPDKQAAGGDHIYDWNDRNNWSELDTRSIPQPAPTGPSDHPAEPALAATHSASEQSESLDDFETWARQQEIDDDFDPALLEKQPWFKAEQASVPETLDASDEIDVTEHVSLPADAAGDVPSTLAESENALSESELAGAMAEVEEHIDNWLPQDDPWNTFVSSKEEPAAPPAWLDMLTSFEDRPVVTTKPAAQAPSTSLRSTPQEVWPSIDPAADVIDSTSLQSMPQAVWPPVEQEDDDMGWPEWLKSLGAETLEPEHPAQAGVQQPVSSNLRESHTPDSTSLTAGAEKPQIQHSEVSPDDAADSWTAQVEQPVQETPPDKEASLVTTLEALEQNLRSQGFVPLQPGSLSALAQETPQPAPTTSPLTELEALSTAGHVTTTAPVPGEPAEPMKPPETAISADQPAPSLDMLLDSELETTMRRPAIHLQSMQAPSPQMSLRARGMDYSSKSADSTLTNKERLVRGYQLQLSGSYDEAMQEYRWLIRNSPESLGEVISNVRALLKLVPKYTAGYRVLGDAYMRQGEYLQAMEAYNKALTIAKKAKSQGR